MPANGSKTAKGVVPSSSRRQVTVAYFALTGPFHVRQFKKAIVLAANGTRAASSQEHELKNTLMIGGCNF